MPEVELLATGEGEYRLHDPDALRAWMRDRKRRERVDETTTLADAVDRPLADNDHASFDCSSFTVELVNSARTFIGRTAKS